jgi:hypothetical protein
MMSDLVLAIDQLLDFVREHHGRDLEPDGPEHKLLKELDAEVYAQCKVAGMTLPPVACVDYPPDICAPFGHSGVPHMIMPHFKPGIPLHQSKIRACFYLDPAWEQAMRGLRREAELRLARKPPAAGTDEIEANAAKDEEGVRGLKGTGQGKNDHLEKPEKRAEPSIPPEDCASCRTLDDIAEYAKKEFGHKPSTRSIQNWKESGSLRVKKRGSLWDFSRSDLKNLVVRPKNDK